LHKFRQLIECYKIKTVEKSSFPAFFHPRFLNFWDKIAEDGFFKNLKIYD